MNPRLEKLLRNNANKKKLQQEKVRKLGNTKNTWNKKDMKKATIWIE